MGKILIRFKDLKQRGIVRSWAQLANLIRRENFPAGFLLSANTRCWYQDSVESWLATRPTDAKATPRRPRKTEDAAAAVQG